MLDFSRFEALTFDCYGTLIDWEAGILQALRPVLAVRGVRATDDEVLAHYARFEAEAEHGEYMPYREVLRQVVERIGDVYGFTPEDRERDRLPDSMRRWPPFSDTVAALRVLGARYRLGIISNVDFDLFEATEEKLRVAFDRLVTAELCRSYKPHRRNFNTMLALLDLPRERVLHVAESLFHDIKPANDLGIATVWVNRRKGRGGTPGASGTCEAQPSLEVPDMATLARLAG